MEVRWKAEELCPVCSMWAARRLARQHRRSAERGTVYSKLCSSLGSMATMDNKSLGMRYTKVKLGTEASPLFVLFLLDHLPRLGRQHVLTGLALLQSQHSLMIYKILYRVRQCAGRDGERDSQAPVITSSTMGLLPEVM